MCYLIIANILVILSLGLDDLSAGTSYGLQNNFIPFKSIGIITLGSSISTFLSMNLGQLGRIIFDPTVSVSLSGLLLTGLAYYYLYHVVKNLRLKSRMRHYTYLQWHQVLNYWDIFHRGIEIPLVDFVTAFSLALAGFPIFLTLLLWKISEVVMLLIGIQLGKNGFTKMITNKLGLGPGLILLTVGFIRLFLKVP